MNESPSVFVVGLCKTLHEKYCIKTNRLENKINERTWKEWEVNVKTIWERLGHL